MIRLPRRSSVDSPRRWVWTVNVSKGFGRRPPF